MNDLRSFILVVIFMLFSLACANGSDVNYYTNKWIVHVPYGEIAAKVVARSHGLAYEKPDFASDGFYHMIKTELPSKTFIHFEKITNELINNELVSIAFQESVKSRSYRNAVNPTQVIPRKLKSESNYINTFNDLYWSEMWYFQDYRANTNDPVLDMNVVPVYFKLGITGKNVNITVADDGLEWTHVEIIDRFNPDLSWNYISDDSDIIPDSDGMGGYRAHGTRCAGEIIMKPNNKICGVGVAHGASIGGIKFLDEASTDVREANVLKHALKYVHIYSNSWGPADTGTYMENLTKVVRSSLSMGIVQGRNGKGVIYVFAAGNGKSEGDNCACDGYVNSIYTVVIASCDDNGHVTHYSERCSAIMATAYSGAGGEKNVLTSDVNGRCTNQHTGTSAAAPLVSGVIGLALSANPNLTWRDVYHLLAWTSQVTPLSDNLGWNKNKRGFYYSVDFGFGLVNAYNLVQAAMKWKNVPEMASCAIRMPNVAGFPISRNKAARVTVKSNGCNGKLGEINFIEHVQLVISMTYPRRGDIQIAMKSPAGTEVHVLESRFKDFSNQGLKRWTFSILAFWGESPEGSFTIDIFDKTGIITNAGRIVEMTLAMHGTKEAPDIYRNGHRPYDKFTLPTARDKPRFFNLSSKEGRNIKDSQMSEIENNIPHINHQNALIDENTMKQVEDIEFKFMQQDIENTISKLQQKYEMNHKNIFKHFFNNNNFY